MAGVALHIHSNVSDGRLSPAEIIRKSAEGNIVVISLTDHDTVDGIRPALEAARDFPKLRVIPGVEISTDISQGEVHILGYFIDYTNDELLATLNGMRNSRQKRAQGMISRLKELGLTIEWARVKEIAGAGSIGRPHVAQAMLEKGYISSIQEAFAKFIGRGGPAYVERGKISPLEIVKLIVRANGLPVLAHPITVNDLETTITELKAGGLVGIETYYGNYTIQEVDTIIGLASKHSLITTGGSDFHGLDMSMETVIGGTDVPMESVEQLIALANHRVLEPVNLLTGRISGD